MKIPTLITAGDSAGWTDNAFADPSGTLITSSGGWALAYSFRGPQASGGLDLAGTAQGTGWALALTPAQTAALNTGAAALVWSWHAYATKAGSRITAGYGTVKVLPNLAALAVAALAVVAVELGAAPAAGGGGQWLALRAGGVRIRATAGAVRRHAPACSAGVPLRASFFATYGCFYAHCFCCPACLPCPVDH